MKTAILIHGYHLGAREWGRVVWGNPPTTPGMIPRGVAIAVELDAALVFWGTGGSEQGGQKESECAFALALERLPEHAAFLKDRSYLDLVTTNTTEEVRACIEMCRARGIGRLILVANATHAPRSLNEALVAAEGTGVSVMAYPALTAFTGHGPGDTVVIEPPHRPDHHHSDLAGLAKRMLGLVRSPRVSGFTDDLDALLKKYDV